MCSVKYLHRDFQKGLDITSKDGCEEKNGGDSRGQEGALIAHKGLQAAMPKSITALCLLQ